MCFREATELAHWIKELTSKSNHLSFIADIENHRVEAENCVFYVSRISWKGIRGGNLSGGKKWRLGLILKQHLHGNILSA